MFKSAQEYLEIRQEKPSYPSVRSAKYSISLSSRLLGVFPSCFLNKASLAAWSGRGIYILFSNLLRTAVSRAQGILVAPRTRIPVSSWPTPKNHQSGNVIPCIWTKNSVLTLLEASFSLSFLAESIESISSMKIMAGLLSLAILKRAFISFSDSPTYFEMTSDEEIEKKVPSASVAQALAR